MIQQSEAQEGASPEFLLEALLDRAEAYILLEDLDSASKDASKASELGQNNQQVHQLHQKINRLRQMASRKNYYKILGLEKTSSKADIKKTFKNLAMDFHPDRYPTEATRYFIYNFEFLFVFSIFLTLSHLTIRDMSKEEADNKFREITEAYEILSDDETRQKYDSGEDVSGNAQQHQQHYQQNFHSPFSFFEFRFG